MLECDGIDVLVVADIDNIFIVLLICVEEFIFISDDDTESSSEPLYIRSVCELKAIELWELKLSRLGDNITRGSSELRIVIKLF